MDITDLKRIQGALHDSERRLRDFAEMASDWFWEQDADANFSWVSEGRGATPMAERPYIGKPRWAMFPDGATPEQWEAHKADIAAQRRSGISAIGAAKPRAPAPHQHPRRAGVRCRRHVHRVSWHRPRHHGQIESEQELERAKERAEQAETMLRDAVDSISEGFVIFDRGRSAGDVQRGLSPDLRDVADLLRPGLHFESSLRSITPRAATSMRAGAKKNGWPNGCGSIARRAARQRTSGRTARLIWRPTGA